MNFHEPDILTIPTSDFEKAQGIQIPFDALDHGNIDYSEHEDENEAWRDLEEIDDSEELARTLHENGDSRTAIRASTRCSGAPHEATATTLSC
jgi:hypothetical protein